MGNQIGVEVELRLHDMAWHGVVGRLIEQLDRPAFWPALLGALGDHLAFDSWVALVFRRNAAPLVLAEQAMADGGVDLLFQDYLQGLYQLDPFYVASLESRQPGLIRLDEVAPDRFPFTDYYQRYFRLNIVEDEVQFNLPLDDERTLCLSLGAGRRYSPEEMALLAMVQPWVMALLRQRWRIEAAQLLSLPVEASSAADGLDDKGLTAREKEVARLMLGGHSSKAIAGRLSISVETVRVHKKHLYAKLGVNSQSELFSAFLRPRSE
ncbi:helix-turn-helix transcriptional regulator [uncultured Aquitalea sp.]|uniref:helix-turn-helix transcriptional regulator n=1 Tax=uncultured Aquitalea sp. TaxID=540272 RepID=UPI0025FC3A74|nr:helix-turn-helix transcriptional regulator [uncultured Aquitalea sp.]